MRILIIIIVLLLLLILNSKNEKFFNSKLSINQIDVIDDIDSSYDVLNNNWQEYRLGDIIRGYINRDSEYFKKFEDKFKKSIGYEFYIRSNGNANYKLLYDMIREKSYNYNRINCCVHLRLGDVLTNDNNPNDIYVTENGYRKQYNYSYNNYMKVANTLKYFYNIDEITIIGGAHKNSNLNKSLNFVNNIKNIFKDKKYKVNIRLGNNPDEDFLLMCNCRLFVKAGGGYSQIISDYVKFNNNIVIDPLKL